MRFAGDPVHVVGVPVHDFQLAGLPRDGLRLFLLGQFVVVGLDQLAVAEDVFVQRAMDGEVALGGPRSRGRRAGSP